MNAFNPVEKTISLSNGKEIIYFSLPALEESGMIHLKKLPFSIKVLLESLLRMQSHPAYTEDHIRSFCAWRPDAKSQEEFPYMPSRVLLQDFTGVPCVVDLAALRAALKRAGKNPKAIEPQIPVDLVIDHSVQIDEFRGINAYDINLEKEFKRNHERYVFLRWGQHAFEKLRVLPPGLGICHQVNMEYLASCVGTCMDQEGRTIAFPDTLVGTDSHTTMVNSMGVLGWGVGGIEAEAAMLGQPVPMLTPKVLGCRLVGKIEPGCTPTDAALEITQQLREKGVVGQFVEYFGPALQDMTVADRAPIANMAPEYGATMGLFPIDSATTEYLRMTGRSEEQIELVETYLKAQGLWYDAETPEPDFSDVLEIDLTSLEPSLAGPRRPQDRVPAKKLHIAFKEEFSSRNSADAGQYGTLKDGDVVIASITSCTNTSNPSLLIGAGLLAKKAVEAGLKVPPYVKTSLAPGSRVVTEYLKQTGLLPYLEQLGFRVVAYGCTTCIGNSGPLPEEIEKGIKENHLVVSAVLSGNRNFEGRVHPLTKVNYLASPPLVVAYALSGNVGHNLYEKPLGEDQEGRPVFLNKIWPSHGEIQELLKTANNPEIYKAMYADIVESSPAWSQLPDKTGAVFEFDERSTYIREPNFFENLETEPSALSDIHGAKILLNLGDFITTDHISPAGKIPEGPSAEYLRENNVHDTDRKSVV